MSWIMISDRRTGRRLKINKDHIEMIEELTKHNQVYKGYVLDDRREIDYYRIYLDSGIIIETNLYPKHNFPVERWKAKQSTKEDIL